jgi:predicted permease
VRHTLRTFRREAGFAAFAVLMLAIGIGANTAVFSIADTVLVKPLPFRDPGRLVWVANTGKGGGLSAVTSRTSNLRDWRRLNHSFTDLGAYFAFFDYGGYTLTGLGEPERLVGVGVTRTFLDVLGVQPAPGRNFVDEECVWNGRPAVILTYPFWQRRFGGDAAVVGRSLTLNGVASVVVGVLPASFDFASIFSPGSRIDLLRPFPVSDETDRQGNTLATVGRLKPGVSVAQAQEDLDRINAQLKREDPGRWGLGAAVTPLRAQVSGRFRRALILLMCGVGAVLLIACANLSNLLLARSVSRRKEMAMRSALGASRGRLVRQMLTESFVLALAGAALGTLLAWALVRAVAGTTAISIPLLATVALDWRALAFTAAAAAATGLIFGLVPALQVSRRGDLEALNDAGRGTSEGRARASIRSALMVAEMAMACMLIVGAGLLLRSFVTLLDVDLGFDAGHAAKWRIDPGRRYAQVEDRRVFYQRLVERVEGLPGVTAVGMTDALPFGRNRSWTIQARGETYGPGQVPTAFPRLVDPGYLGAMRIALVAGRGFTPFDTSDTEPVMVVNQTLARQLWPGRDAVGQVALIGRSEWHVVGVVADVHHGSLEQQSGLEMYMPIAQQTDFGSLELVVRSTVPPASLAPGLRAALHDLDPAVPLGEFTTLQGLVDQAVSPRRFLLQVFGAFALAALALAALGIYGVVAYSVRQRQQEFGIRMALGASGPRVQASVLGRTLALALAGVAIGAAGALALGRAVASLLYGVQPTDPATFAAVAALLTAVAVLAAYVPARRASRVDLAEVLRSA